MIFFMIYLQKDLDTLKSIYNNGYFSRYYDVLQSEDF